MLIAHKIALDLNNAQARPGVPDRLHPAHGAGAGPATFRDPRGPRGLCGNGAECESPRSRSLCAAPANALGPSGEGPRARRARMRTISTSSYCPISARSGGTTSSSTASTSSTAVSCEAKGLAYKFARSGVSTSFRYTLWVVASRLRNRNVRLRESCEWPPSRPTRGFIAVAAFGRQLRESDALRSPTPRQSSNLGIRFLVDAFARPQHLVAT